jgi:hypothetical protein
MGPLGNPFIGEPRGARVASPCDQCPSTFIILWFEKVGPKPLYVCTGCSIHMYSNNMIQMQCSIKHSNYSLHNDPWVLKGLHKCSRTKCTLGLHKC